MPEGPARGCQATLPVGLTGNPEAGSAFRKGGRSGGPASCSFSRSLSLQRPPSWGAARLHPLSSMAIGKPWPGRPAPGQGSHWAEPGQGRAGEGLPLGPPPPSLNCRMGRMVPGTGTL